ncbi:Sporulation domain-containing protein [Desulfurispirillum indicum S5]|uniref:Sporulation domain-containing protein n=1 Tax=Desulfurispirillum indicum (strain ATCC BAA-1389 / DSM 22839 / S5) TaxID=653733 RepID=E6W3R2_DESIS|nr:SPOR domain-containing protein [Desulfurispirillum indicum]ADU66943.1 Sporulation domain-containing protein [Desulfurispirillum indicum S5]
MDQFGTASRAGRSKQEQPNRKSGNQTFATLIVFIVGLTLVFALGVFAGRMLLGSKEMDQRISVLQPDTETTTVLPPNSQPLSAPTAPGAPTAPELKFAEVPPAQEAQRAAEQAQATRQEKDNLLARAKQEIAAPTTPSGPQAPSTPQVSSPAEPTAAKTAPPAAPATATGEGSLKRTVPAGKFTIQIAAFRDEQSAQSQAKALKEKGYDAYYMVSDQGDRGIWYRVRVGEFGQLDAARTKAEQIKEKEKLFPFPIEVN